MRRVREPDVYNNSMDAATDIFQVTKGVPDEETYSLVDQMRRSSRSICANPAEAWRKRRYEKSFISKLSEAAETRVGIDLAGRRGYGKQQAASEWIDRYDRIPGPPVSMIHNADSWIINPECASEE